MVTVSYNDDTFGYHITGHRSLSRTVMIHSGIILHGHRSLSRTVMIPSGIYSTFGYKQLVPISASKVYAGMKHKTNDKYMHMIRK